MMIYKSRFTPNLKNGKDVDFRIGEIVKYRMSNSSEVENIKIDSEKMSHNSGYLGYEAIILSNNKRVFIVDEGIIGWDGKVD